MKYAVTIVACLVFFISCLVLPKTFTKKKLERPVIEDTAYKYEQLIETVPRVNNGTKTGAGVLFANDVRDRYFIITVAHLARGRFRPSIIAPSIPIELPIYTVTGELDYVTFSFIKCLYNEELDLALYEMEEKKPKNSPYWPTAILPKRSEYQVYVFQKIVMVGYPEGYGPYHTEGEVGYLEKEKYFSVNANGFYGNSGGAIYDAETYELLGIVSKLLVNGMFPITHITKAVYIDIAYKWFDENEYGFLVPE